MTNIFKELKNNDYITQNQFKKASSLFLGEKFQEGYYLAGGNLMSTDYERMYVLQNDENERFGFGIKIVDRDYYCDSFDIVVQWGKLKKYGLFEFEDEENATVETFKAVGNSDNKIYYNEEKFKEVKEKKEKRFDYKYGNNTDHIFRVKKLNIKGLKREKDIKVRRIANRRNRNIAYQIYKNDKVYKEVNF